VARALGEAGDFRSAQQLHADLAASATPVGLATVYRALADLMTAGRVDALTRPDGETVYRACSAQHHHHLVCTVCGTTVEVADDRVEQWASEMAKKHGFDVSEHQVEVFGRCANCRGN
jgi:Fur family ferric uptake transcriptional regulator